MTEQIRIVIADDDKKIRAYIRELVERQRDMKVIAEVGNGPDAIVCVKEQLPDILLLDISMPGMNGLQVLKRIRHDHPHTQVVIVSSSTDRDSVEEAQELGAHGYIVKRDLEEELILGVQRVMGGGIFLSKAVSQERLVSGEDAPGTSATTSPRKDVPNGQQSETAGLQANKLDPQPVAGDCYEPRKITVFVVEDEPHTIRYISDTLTQERRIALVGLSKDECYQVCTSVATIVEQIQERNPDLVVVDLNLGSHDRGGWQVINALRKDARQKKKPQVPVIILTRTVDQYVVSQAWRNGIAGYVPKLRLEEELLQAVLAVHSGETHYSPSLGERVWRPSPETLRLTPRGRQVFYLFVMDRSTEQIAEELGMDEDTVWGHESKNRQRIGPELGWKDVDRVAKNDPSVLKALTERERKVFDAYVKDPGDVEHIAAATGFSVLEVKDLVSAMHDKDKVGCYPGGWFDIARKERAI